MSRRTSRWILIWVCFLGCGTAAAAFGWKSASQRISRGLIRSLENIWNGPVTIERPRFPLFGPMQIGSVSLFDSSGRQCIRAEQVSLDMDGWPVFTWQLREIRVTNLFGSFPLPFAHSVLLDKDWESDFRPHFKVRIRVDRCSIDLIHPKGSIVRYQDLVWQLNSDGDQLHLLVIQNPWNSSDFVFAEGTADWTKKRISIRFDATHTLTRGEMGLIQSLDLFPRWAVGGGRFRSSNKTL